MKIKSIACLGAAVCLLFFSGCERPATSGDKTNPEITVFVSRARGRNYFRSVDGVQTPPNNCIIVREMPTQLILIAGDLGGIQRVGIRIIPGTIVRETLEITPAAPESSHTITRDRESDELQIALTPPSPTTVRTGATATFDINGTLPLVVYAFGRDRAGNYAEVAQFELRGPDEGVVCRGS